MIKQYVVFGESAVNAACEGKFKKAADLGCIGCRTFNTEEERLAYLRGIEDTVGWMEAMPLNSDDVRKLSKRVPLSTIENLEEND